MPRLTKTLLFTADYLTLVGTGAVVAALLLALWSNRIALRAVDAESRPWLHLTKMECQPFLLITNDPNKALLHAILIIENTGRTAASNVVVGYRMVDDITGKGWRFWRSPMPQIHIENVLPARESKPQIFVDFDKISADGGIGPRYLAVRIHYTGPGQIRRRNVCQFWHFGGSEAYGALQPIPSLDAINQGMTPVARVMFTVRMN